MQKGTCLKITLTTLSLSMASGLWADALEFASSISLERSDDRFGGLSAIELDDRGDTFVAVSDRGNFVEGAITRRDGRIVGVDFGEIKPVRKIDGNPVTSANFDAEGLAIGSNGVAFISFEGFHRVRRYPSLDGAAENLPGHPDFQALQTNSSLEALAIDGLGRLYTVPERSGNLERPFPLYRFADGRWDRFGSIERLGEYLIAGADIGPDGKFYLLERGFRGIAFSTRIRRFSIGANGLIDGETLLISDYGRHDNLEGISVWRDDENIIRVTLVSDDNFRFFQRTELVEYLLKPDE